MMPHKQRNNSEQQHEQNNDQKNEAIARDALFIAQRAQAAHAAGGEIVHETRIARAGATEMIADAIP